MMIDFRPNPAAQGRCQSGSRNASGACDPNGYSGRSCGGGGDVSSNSCGTGNLGQTFYCVNGVQTSSSRPCDRGNGYNHGSQCSSGGNGYNYSCVYGGVPS